jgi:hypothetical protein
LALEGFENAVTLQNFEQFSGLYGFTAMDVKKGLLTAGVPENRLEECYEIVSRFHNGGYLFHPNQKETEGLFNPTSLLHTFLMLEQHLNQKDIHEKQVVAALLIEIIRDKFDKNSLPAGDTLSQLMQMEEMKFHLRAVLENDNRSIALVDSERDRLAKKARCFHLSFL